MLDFAGASAGDLTRASVMDEVPTRPPAGRSWVTCFRLFVLLVEALLGAGVARLLSPDGAWAAGMGAATALSLVLADALVAPPFTVHRRRALRALAAVAVVEFCLTGTSGLAAMRAVAWLVPASVAVVAWRSGALRAARHVPALMPARRSVAFIGNSEAALRMFRQIRSDRFSTLDPVGFFDDRAERRGPLDEVLPLLGGVDSVAHYIHYHALDEVYMALPWAAGARIAQLTERLRFLPITVRLLPDHLPPALRGHGRDQVEGVVMPTLMLPVFSHLGAIAKRTIDVVGAVAVLIPLLPLLAATAVAIKLDSRGPVFFLQARSGRYGRSFKILKFRSLHVARADEAAETLVGRGDRRVTRVGRYLRKYSVDELPQLFNVLWGDMSLVGPRPHAPRAKADGRIYAEVVPEYMMRYRVKPGITGWAQVNGWRGNTDTEEKLRKRVEFDFDYIASWTLLRDFLILLKTVPSVVAPTADNV
jgi:Undecaprenyl-phosphate glucose phosphotransferase